MSGLRGSKTGGEGKKMSWMEEREGERRREREEREEQASFVALPSRRPVQSKRGRERLED